MGSGAAKGDDLQERLTSLGAKIIQLSTRLPRTPQGRHISLQILRSGTGAAANYGEARGAESRADFIHKLGIVLKELNETSVWLDMTRESSLLSARKIAPYVEETQELSRIITASIKTARRGRQ